MSTNPTLGAVVSYIELHRTQYSRHQLKARLLQDGIDPALVEHALNSVYGFDQSFDQAYAQANPRSHIVKAFLATLFLNCLVYYACLALLIGHTPEVLFIGLAVLVLELIASFVISMVGRTAIATGIFFALLLSILPINFSFS